MITPAEIALLFTVIGNSVTIIVVAFKVISSTARFKAITEEKIKTLESQINNDIAGRRVVAEVREDVAAIKAQIVDIHSEIKHLRGKEG